MGEDMIDQSNNQSASQNGLAVDTDTHHRDEGDNQDLEKPTQTRPTNDPRPSEKRKPRRFSYQSGAKVLPGYTIKRGIGIGGFGEVYFAISDAGKEVALKRIQRNLDVEIRGVSQCLNLKHINLISLWDIRQDTEGESWVVMEYVPGESLRDVLERNPDGIPDERGKKWFQEILAGVNYLHDHGIVHRDLKPGNVFYDQDENVVKIGDYGLSKFISTSKRDGQTESVGTFHYMAPEIGKGSYGKEIDVYSLGIILCEILSGRVPFDGESGQEIIMKHLTATPQLDFIPKPFRPVILKALSKDPDRRFSSVMEMAEVLDWEGNRLTVATGSLILPDSESGPQTPIVETMFLHDDEPMYIADDPVNAGAPVNADAPLDDDGIQMGELTERAAIELAGQNANDQPEREEPWTANEDGSIRMSNVKSPNDRSTYSPAGKQPVVSDRVVQHDVAAIISSSSQEKSEPIAKAVSTGYQTIADWWNGIGGTPFKVALVVVLAIFVLFNAQWLIPVCIIAGCSYMAYFAIRATMLARQENTASHDATVIRPFSRKECLELVEKRLRETRFGIPFSEKFAESLGSVLTATFVVAVSALVAIGFSGFSLDGSSATLSLFTWISLTALLGASISIFFTKIFESSIGNQWKRRFVLMAAGLLMGAVSFGIYQSFFISQISFPERISSLEKLSWITAGNTGLMRFMTFFAGYLLIIRWWKVGDPLRTSQLSILSLILHVIVAVGVALLASFPVIWALIIGGTMSLAIQMSSTWIRTSDRERIQFEVMQSVNLDG